MNKFLILSLLNFFILSFSQPVLAEGECPQEMTQAQREQFHKQLFKAKLAEMVYQLQMTDQQKTRFTPIYSQYCEEMSNVFHKTRTRDITDEAQKAKMRMQRQQQAQTIRLKYFDEFSKVLNDDQMGKLYKVEDAIQKKLKERHRRATTKQGN